MSDLSRHPFPITYRELWIPSAINQDQDGSGQIRLPSSVRAGNALTATGAQKRTTADGVRFTGGATSNIVVANNAAQNAKAALNITVRFKLAQNFVAGAPTDMYLFTKVASANDWILIKLENSNGQLYWQQSDGVGGTQFTLNSSRSSWVAGTWYTVTCSMTDAPAQRLIVDGVLENSGSVAARNTPNGGDITLANYAVGNNQGFVGVISHYCIGVGATAAVALTTAEETDLSNGIPPATAKVQHMYLMDEGRGVTVNDRGSVGVNGTLDSACTWAFGQVRQPVLSPDGINDYAASGAGVNISGNSTLIWVGKIKGVYNSLFTDHTLCLIRISDNDNLHLWYQSALNVLRMSAVAGGVTAYVGYSSTVAIDNYLIFVSTVTSGSLLTLFVNGSSVGTNVPSSMSSTLATCYLGSNQSPGNFDVSRPLFCALIEGALTAAQVRTYSRFLKNCFNLPVNI